MVQPRRPARVVYDHRIFSSQRYGGISRYFVELASRIARTGEWEAIILSLAHVNHYLPPGPTPLVRGRRVPPIPRTGRLRQRVNDLVTRAYLVRRRPDVIHESYFGPRGLGPPGVPTVVTVYDMIHELFPSHFADAHAVARDKAAAVLRAEHVICISHCTRRDLLTRVPVDPRKVSVVHLASAFEAPEGASVAAAALPGGRPYVLYVGDRGGYKNFGRLVEAIGLARTARGLGLVAFGGGRFTPGERAAFAAAGIPPDAARQCRGDDVHLASLYAGAAVLCYPSLYEGFGIPPLEAMACACPVICGAVGSLPEVVGDAAEFCDPGSPASIAAAIDAVVASPARADALRQAGRARAALFSWDRCADETLAVYRSLA